MTDTSKMTDKELLELAAKAAGLKIGRCDDYFTDFTVGFNIEGTNLWWNALTDDGDAFRLAVELRMSIMSNETVSWVATGTQQIVRAEECHDELSPYAATRRAIVRAAAAIGEQM